MNAATVTLILGLLGLIAQYVPILIPKRKDLMDSLKGTEVVDLTHDELVSRIDNAIAALPEWI